MRQRLFTLVSSLSLILWLFSVGFVASSFYEDDDIGWRTRLPNGTTARNGMLFVSGATAFYRVIRATGSVLSNKWGPMESPHGPFWETAIHPDHFVLPGEASLGFGIGMDAAGKQYFRFPLWLPALVTAVLPITWLKQRRLQRQYIREGRCVKCGYDLRATPSECPECGTPAISSKHRD